MFKKSKKAEAGSRPAEKPAKGKKEKKSKGGADQSSIKDFLFQHVEKIVLAAIVGAIGYLVFDGMNAPKYDTSKTPSTLKELATTVGRDIVKDNWLEIAMEEERKVNAVYAANAERTNRPTDPTPYATDIWEVTPRSSGEKRKDPKILPPVDLRGFSVSGAMAVKARRRSDRLEGLQNAPPVGERYRPRADDPEPADRMLAAKYDRGFEGVGNSAEASPSGDDGFNMDPGGAGGMGGPPKGDRGRGPMFSNAGPEYERSLKSVRFNAVTAIVPHEQMGTMYDENFINTSGYDPGRDSPNYLGFEVQRVDVTGKEGEPIAEADWQPLDSANPEQFMDAVSLWDGENEEVVYQDYTHESLTMPIPPVMIQDYRPYSRHPMVPFRGQIGKVKVDDTEEESEEDFQKRMQEGQSNHGNSGSGYPGMGGGMPGMGGGMPGMGMGGPPGGNFGGPPGGGYGGGPPGGGYGGPGGGGFGGPPGGGFGASIRTEPLPRTDYKVVRFFDFNVEENHSYRYRVRVLMDDPNYPKLAGLQPPLPSLEASALARVQKVLNADRDKNKTLQEGLSDVEKREFVPERSSGRLTEWSEPSPVIVVDSGNEVYAGAVLEAASTQVRNGKVGSVPTPDGEAMQMVLAEWDHGRGVFVPRVDTVHPGDVLVGKYRDQDQIPPQIFHPLDKKVVMDPDYSFSSTVTVIDVNGGEPLAESNGSRDPLFAIGRVLAIDPITGEVFVSDEYTEFSAFQMYSFADERAKAAASGDDDAAAGPGGGAGGGGKFGDMGDMGGMGGDLGDF